MPDLAPLCDIISRLLPFECLKPRFMQQALIGLILLAPMAAAMGVQVVNFRMAFFSDAISHSVFAGVALGLIFSVDPHWTMPIFGLLVGIGITAVQRRSALASDTIIGVFFSSVIAFGLAVVSRDRGVARDLQRFLYGDILTIGDTDILILAVLFVALFIFQAWGYNRMLYIGLHPVLAEAHRVKVSGYQYIFACFLSLVVIVSVWGVGILLVTALLIVPAAAGRNFARSAGGMFWWALGVSLFSAVSGLILSAQPFVRTAAGATVVLVAAFGFGISMAVSSFRDAFSR